MNGLATYKSYSEYAQLGYIENSVLESRLEGTHGISLVKIVQGPGSYPDPPMPEVSLQFCKRGKARGRLDLGHGYFDVNIGLTNFSLSPANVATDFELDGNMEIWIIGFPAFWLATLTASIHKTIYDFGSLHRSLQTDKSITRLVEQLHHLDTLEAGNALLVDGLSMALVGKLVTLSQREYKRREVPALDKFLLAQVQSYLEQRIAENPTLEELAALTDMSVYEFAKRFKTATGFSPYQYVLAQRLERAKDLLEHSQLPLADVAYSVGFSSQAHMSKVFKERLGYTPKAYRKELSN
jgi:AraC family transcriptional regulator